jgi:hypothetical protein
MRAFIVISNCGRLDRVLLFHLDTSSCRSPTIAKLLSFLKKKKTAFFKQVLKKNNIKITVTGFSGCHPSLFISQI